MTADSGEVKDRVVEAGSFEKGLNRVDLDVGVDRGRVDHEVDKARIMYPELDSAPL